MHIFLIRHGETDFNLEKRFQGHLDVRMNEKGKEHCYRAFENFFDLPANIDLFTSSLKSGKFGLYSSDLSRAALTGDIFAEVLAGRIKRYIEPSDAVETLAGLRVRRRQNLREFDVGLFAGKTFEEAKKEYPDAVAKFLDEFERKPATAPYPEGESIADVFIRAKAVRKEIAFLETAVLVSHGGFLRCMYEEFCQHPYVGSIANCEILSLKASHCSDVFIKI